MIVKVKVNVGVEVMKPVLSKNNVEVRKLVNLRKAPCEIISSKCIADGSDCIESELPGFNMKAKIPDSVCPSELTWRSAFGSVWM